MQPSDHVDANKKHCIVLTQLQVNLVSKINDMTGKGKKQWKKRQSTIFPSHTFTWDLLWPLTLTQLLKMYWKLNGQVVSPYYTKETQSLYTRLYYRCVSQVSLEGKEVTVCPIKRPHFIVYCNAHKTSQIYMAGQKQNVS